MKSLRVDLTGQSFERLTVLSYAGNDQDRRALWRCACSCGKDVVVLGKWLRAGRVKSCGCLRKEMIDNTRSIVERDPEFAKVYLAEKALLLEVLRDGDPVLWAKAAAMLTANVEVMDAGRDVRARGNYGEKHATYGACNGGLM